MYNGYGYPPPHQAQQPSWQAQTPQQQYGYNNVGATHQAPPYGGPGGYIQPMQQHIPNPAYTAPAPAPVPPQYGLSQQAGHNSYYAGAPPVSHSACTCVHPPCMSGLTVPCRSSTALACAATNYSAILPWCKACSGSICTHSYGPSLSSRI